MHTLTLTCTQTGLPDRLTVSPNQGFNQGPKRQILFLFPFLSIFCSAGWVFGDVKWSVSGESGGAENLGLMHMTSKGAVVAHCCHDP